MRLAVFDPPPFQPADIERSRAVRDARQQALTVLVAEYDADQRSLLEIVLVRAGYRVLNACAGDEALAHLSVEAVDAVISDLTMDHDDGFDLLRRIRAHAQVHAAYLLVTTGVMLDLSRLEELNLEPENYLQKPFAPSELLARLRSGIQTLRSADRPASENSQNYLPSDTCARGCHISTKNRATNPSR
jgi:DNA-binding response OmpR family regulator